MATFTHYNTLNAGKAWEIKGATNEDGAVYCPACLDKWGVDVEGEDYGPIFANDKDALNAGLACATCNERIDGGTISRCGHSDTETSSTTCAKCGQIAGACCGVAFDSGLVFCGPCWKEEENN